VCWEPQQIVSDINDDVPDRLKDRRESSWKYTKLRGGTLMCFDRRNSENLPPDFQTVWKQSVHFHVFENPGMDSVASIVLLSLDGFNVAIVLGFDDPGHYAIDVDDCHGRNVERKRIKWDVSLGSECSISQYVMLKIKNWNYEIKIEYIRPEARF
jgi:hypothetical protein